MNENKIINGVMTKKMKIIKTKDFNGESNGWILDGLFGTDEIKEDGKNNYGQVYVTSCLPGKVKGFHLHEKKTDHFWCVGGMTKWILIDARPDSPTFNLRNEFLSGDDNPIIIRVPPGVKHAFKNISKNIIFVINYMNPAFDQNDSDTKTTNEKVEW